jgi:hypothetical protein
VPTRSLLSILVVSVLVGCGGAHLDPSVAKRLAVAKASKDLAYWLGPRYDGLKLIHVESGSEAFFASSLYYGDCSWFDLNSLSPSCHRLVEVDNDVPAPGEISTQGRCIFSTSVNGVTVATFPVNPDVLRVFARRATVLVSSRRRSETLKAIAALEPLNGHPLVRRDVSAALGTCKVPAPKPPVRLSAKQRYEQLMKASFVVESTGEINLNAVDPVAAKPRLVLDEFLNDAREEPALLRNEASRIEDIHPPAVLATEQTRLVAELRAYAAVLDDVLAAARRDGLDDHRWTADRRLLDPRIAAASGALAHTVQAFRAHGYSIYAQSSD